MIWQSKKKFGLFFLSTLILSCLSLSKAETQSSSPYDDQLFNTLKWRCVGPYRGGRITAVAGVPDNPLVYYFGSAGGGVWKTDDGGLNWNPISDGFFKSSSVGAIAVSESNPNVIYVGMGGSCLRNDISDGDGLYKSEDAGKTWTHIGLHESRHIGRIRIHPQDSNLVYVAVLGNVYGSSKERGVYRSKDGGKTWEKILFIDEKTGAVDLAMDVTNPNILYAATWQVIIKPWGILSGGPGTGLHTSIDSGDNWQRISQDLPTGKMGRVGVAVSPVNPNRIWTLVAAENGGLFRSDDRGKTWRLVSQDWNVRKRHAYYTHVYADTQDQDTVYVLASKFLKSTDGGNTFSMIQEPHGDNHDLWIAPENNLRMINGNDGGANVSFNGGKSWTRQDNQPTAQIYRVTTDNQFPYRIYGAQQDNTTLSLPSRQTGREIVPDMYRVAGGESGTIAVHPIDSHISYGGSYWGRLTRYDLHTKENRDVSVWPEIPLGRPPIELKYRFNWTFPILISPHDPSTIYAAANILFKSTNEGQSWQPISPDLTRNDKSKQKDAILTQIYCTITAFTESSLRKDCLWAGTDDGLVHISLDGGQNWQNVTPKLIPQWSRVARIESSPHQAQSAYIAVNRFDLDDRRPYILKTDDYGKSWQSITNGIPENDHVHVVREDPKRRGLLYAGTERGIYVSFNNGESWQSLQLNLPVVPVYDLKIKEDDLIAATHGRSFWILDDLTLLHQITPKAISSEIFLFKPRDTYRTKHSELLVRYILREPIEGKADIEIVDEEGMVIKTFELTKKDKNSTKKKPHIIDSIKWDLRYPEARGIEGGTFLLRSNLRGPVALPGLYRARLSSGTKVLTETFQIKKDPRISVPNEELKEQFDFLMKIRETLSITHDTVNEIRASLKDLGKIINSAQDIKVKKNVIIAAQKLKKRLEALLEDLISTKTEDLEEFRFHMHNHPFHQAIRLKLNNRIASIKSVVETAERKPTDQCYQNFNVLSSELKVILKAFKEISENDIPAFNKLIRDSDFPSISERREN